MKETLVILAAGMGSRYGGLKQMDSVGSNGDSIIDFTIYDAIKSGFKRLVLIIRKEHEEAFEENLVKKIRPFIEVEYAYQDLNDTFMGLTKLKWYQNDFEEKYTKYKNQLMEQLGIRYKNTREIKCED